MIHLTSSKNLCNRSESKKAWTSSERTNFMFRLYTIVCVHHAIQALCRATPGVPYNYCTHRIFPPRVNNYSQERHTWSREARQEVLHRVHRWPHRYSQVPSPEKYDCVCGKPQWTSGRRDCLPDCLSFPMNVVGPHLSEIRAHYGNFGRNHRFCNAPQSWSLKRMLLRVKLVACDMPPPPDPPVHASLAS